MLRTSSGVFDKSIPSPLMSRTYNNKKKIEGRLRKEQAKLEKERIEEQKKEEELERYWSIGTKRPGRKEREEEERIAKQKRREELRVLYEKEMGDL
jgi:hypothetical protein